MGQSVAKPLEYYANNVTGSANLLEVILYDLEVIQNNLAKKLDNMTLNLTGDDGV